MRLVTYRDRDRNIKAGALIDEEIVDISDQVATRHVAFRLLWWNCWLRSKTHRASSALDWHIAITRLKLIRRSPKCRRSS